jgi:hypothetical protein
MKIGYGDLIMNEEQKDTPVDFACRGMLCILDLIFPNDDLNGKAKNEKYFLRKRILDYMHRIQILNEQEEVK